MYADCVSEPINKLRRESCEHLFANIRVVVQTELLRN